MGIRIVKLGSTRQMLSIITTAEETAARARGAALLDIDVGILGKLDGRGLKRNGMSGRRRGLEVLL
jgi:hypothetical protein